MNYKLMKKLTAALLVAGSIGGVGYTAAQLVNDSQNKFEISAPTLQSFDYEKVADFSISPKDPVTNLYTLTINNKDTSKGMVTFGNGKTVLDGLKAGDTVSIHVSIINTDYTIQTVRVHSLSNINADREGNDNCGVNKISDAEYQFTLPSETNALGEPNPFYDGNPNLTVDVAWTLKKINAWEYDWMDNTDSGNYMIKLNQDFIFDDVANPELKMETVVDSATGKPQANVIYRIYMNGHNMAIKNMTIPSGVQLMFINNKGNTVEGTTPVVSLTKDSKFDEKHIHGGIGRWGSVDFAKDLKTILNLNVAHGYWDSNIND